MKQSDWEQDIVNRQRNIVFPDTVQNQGRFYRNILRTNIPLSLTQRAAILVLGIFSLAASAIVLALAVVAIRSDFLYGAISALFSPLTGVLAWKLISRAIFVPSQTKPRQTRRGIVRRRRKNPSS